MQYDRIFTGGQTLSPDGYALTPLPKASIDTGMGLERIACVLQGKLSNYETDLFTPLIARAAELTRFSITSSELSAISNESGHASLRIIADHARAATFLISDGVNPANEGRGYVLRKILRRGIRHGRLLGQEKPFMHEMVLAVRDEMSVAYPELKETAERVAKVVLAEELQFARVLSTALGLLDRDIAELNESIVLDTESSIAKTALRGEARAARLSYEKDLVDSTEENDGWLSPEREKLTESKRILTVSVLSDSMRRTDCR